MPPKGNVLSQTPTAIRQRTKRPPSHMPGARANHLRRPEVERQQCVAINRFNGKRCRRGATSGNGKLCKFHLAKVKSGQFTEAELAEPSTNVTAKTEGPGGGPDPSPGDQVKAGVAMNLTKQAKAASATLTVLNEQSRKALRRLGQPYDPSASHNADPKTVLLGLVAASHQQVLVWQAMLATTPEEHFDLIGVTPVPGHAPSARGARIEQITKFLDAATKTAARVAKMAIDAGIEERLVRLAEEQQNLIADTTRAGIIAAVNALRRAGIIDEAAAQAATDAALGAAANHLRALAAGGQEVIDTVVNATGGDVAGFRPSKAHKPKHVEVVEMVEDEDES